MVAGGWGAVEAEIGGSFPGPVSKVRQMLSPAPEVGMIDLRKRRGPENP